MQENINATSKQNEVKSNPPTVGQNVAEELSRLRDDLWRMASAVQMKAKGASAEVQSTRQALQREVERFSEQVKDAADDTREDLKQTGEDLRMRFQKLANQIVLPAR